MKRKMLSCLGFLFAMMILTTSVGARTSPGISTDIGIAPTDLVAPTNIDPAMVSGLQRITPHPFLESDGRIVTKQLGDFGESIIDAEFRARGFEVLNGNIGDKGIDRIALKRGTNGELNDVRIVEVKTRQTDSDFSLSNTKNGPQLSDSWTQYNLERIVREHPDARMRQLAGEVLEKTRSQPAIVTRELHGISLKSNRYYVWNVDGAGQRMSVAEGRLKDLLEGLSVRGTTVETRAAALRHLSQFDQLQTASTAEVEKVLSASTSAVRGCALRAAGGTAVIVLVTDGAVICYRCANGELTPLQAQEAGTEAVAKAGTVGLATYGMVLLGATPVGITVIVVGGVVYVLVDYAIDELRSSYTSSPMTAAQIDEVMPIGWRREEP